MIGENIETNPRLAKGRRINKCRSRSRETSDLNSGEFSYIRQLFLRRP